MAEWMEGIAEPETVPEVARAGRRSLESEHMFD
jgi:hypothetical protein